MAEFGLGEAGTAQALGFRVELLECVGHSRPRQGVSGMPHLSAQPAQAEVIRPAAVTQAGEAACRRPSTAGEENHNLCLQRRSSITGGLESVI